MTDKYIQELLDKGNALTYEDEQVLFKYYKEHKTKELRAKIVEKNLGLCLQCAHKYQNLGVPLEDLQQEATFGLFTAIDRFEPERGYKFSTYAYNWVEQAIRRYISNHSHNIRLPVHVSEDMSKVKRAEREYARDHAGNAPMEYLVEYTGLTKEKVEQVQYRLAYANTASLNINVSREEGDESELGDFIEDPKSDFTEKVEEQCDFERIYAAMDDILDEREKEVIMLRFGLKDGSPRTLEQIGNAYGVTRERIRQVEAKAIRKLKSPRIKKQYLMGLENYIQ